LLTAGFSIVTIGVIPWLSWDAAPQTWRAWIEAGDGFLPLALLFVALPMLLGFLYVLTMMLAAWVMRPFMNREEAEKMLEVPETGAGWPEGWILPIFKEGRRQDD